MKHLVAIVAASFALCALPGVAFASGGSTCAQYTTTCTVNHITKSRTHSPSATGPATASRPQSTVLNATATRGQTTEQASAGSLPFTGLDVGFLAAGGVVLLGAGLLVRRVSSTD